MRDYLSLGSTPVEENCAQVGSPDYYEKVREEGKRYIELLKKKFGEPPAGAFFKLKGFPHDFGTYHEVCIIFDDEDEAQADFAFHVENNLPSTWEDDQPVTGE